MAGVKKMVEKKGDYFLSMADDLVDYKGDIARNKQRGGEKTYSPDFSPNNIRRLILSGDGMRVDFHIAVEGRKYKQKVFSDSDIAALHQCLMMPDYKPMLWCLSGERVCSSVEEVIVCAKNKSGANLSRELDISGLLRSNRGGDPLVQVASRFKRLAYFTVADCTINELVSNEEVQKAMRSPHDLLSDTEFLSSAGNKQSVNKEWYKGWGSVKEYNLDRAGSPLNNHFHKVKDDIDASFKDKAVRESKEKRLKEVTEGFEKEFRKYSGVYKSYIRLFQVLGSSSAYRFAAGFMQEPYNASLEGYAKPADIKKEFEEMKSGHGECVQELRVKGMHIYTYLIKWLLLTLEGWKKEYPTTYEAALPLLKQEAIAVHPALEDLAAGLGLSLKGNDMQKSVSSICLFACETLLCGKDRKLRDSASKYEMWQKAFG